MPTPNVIKADSWRWFRAELERRLGKADADALWNELARRRAEERHTMYQRTATAELVRLEQRVAEARAAGKSTKRLEQQIARRRALLDE